MKTLRNRLFMFLLGAVSLAVAGEVSPVFSIAFWRLAYSSKFVMGGPGGSDQEVTYRRLLYSMTPKWSFHVLHLVGNNQGRVYAIYGLWNTASPDYKEKRDRFAAEEGEVRWQLGCSVSPISKKRIMEALDYWTGVRNLPEKERANQSLQPTTTAVIPAAEQPVRQP